MSIFCGYTQELVHKEIYILGMKFHVALVCSITLNCIHFASNNLCMTSFRILAHLLDVLGFANL